MRLVASRVRLDKLLVDKALLPSREKAIRSILAGDILVDGRRIDKAGALVEPTSEIEIRGRSPYVSRGGEKLAHALEDFGVAVRGRICIDVGASTGGFTDCLLQRGAARVYAVDVGTGQLDDKLGRDSRVVVMDHSNARGLDPRIFGDKPSLAVVDVAFISLEKVLPAIFGVLERHGETVALVKPQFEAGREAVGKGGVVREPAQHRAVIGRLARYSILRGWHVLGVTASPLRGPKGNREFFLHLSTRGKTATDLESRIDQTVAALA
jgi:23S rRNA (cytidine1920-2'-O)/16S rRNA (cytidine1409-2'-O)-methyltransferase